MSKEFLTAGRRNGKTVLYEQLKEESKRRTQIFKDDDWRDAELIEVKAGDRFRMFEPNGSPVIGPHGTINWVAGKDAYINDLGITQVDW